MGVAQIAGRLVGPASLPRERILPLPPPWDELFPGGGPRRGSVVRVGGSTTLALTVAAGVSRSGAWSAAVGFPHLGLGAAAELGVDLTRFAVVPRPGMRWTVVVAALLDAVDLVLAWSPGRLSAGEARRLVARARERGSVLLAVGDWPEAGDVRLRLASSEWSGLGHGRGHLTARQVEVVSDGRGAAARERRMTTWLPCAH